MKETVAQFQIEEDQSLPQLLMVGDGTSSRRIAYRNRLAKESGRPGIVWLCGFKSDMRSTKASALHSWAVKQDRGFLRFDYSGHGESEGAFESGTIGLWLEDSLAIIRSASQGPQILVGSSMGGWLALLAAQALHASGEDARLAGLVLIAPAVDFTEALMWEQMAPKVRNEVVEQGVWLRPSPYSPDPYPITRELIEEGRHHLMLGGTIRTHCPVHILQGMQDEDVPWRQATKLVEHLAGDPVVLTLVKDGDHRLSRDEDIERLIAAIEAIA